MSIGPPIPEIQHFQSLTLKIQGQVHSSRSQRRYTTLSIHILFVPCQSSLPFLRYSIFKVWPWKSKVKVIAQGHKEGIPPYRFISFSFHVNRPPIPEIQHFQSLTLKIPGQGHSSRSQRRYTTLSIHILFVPCQSALHFLGYSYFKIWHWKFKVKVMGEVKV